MRTVLTVKAQNEFLNQSPLGHGVQYNYKTKSLEVLATGEKFKCGGSGYDIASALLAEMIEKFFEKELALLGNKLKWENHTNKLFYGFYCRKDHEYSLGRGCGEEPMIRIINAIGFSVKENFNKKGSLYTLAPLDGYQKEAIKEIKK